MLRRRLRLGDPSRRSPHQGFLLPLASTAALVLLLSSLSLQTLALQGRRQIIAQLQQRAQEDQLASAAQQLLGTLRLEHPCLLERRLADWDSAPCLAGMSAAALQQGQVGEQRWRLLRFEPSTAGVELQLALGTGGASGAFVLLEGELRPLGLRAAAGVA